MKTTALIAAALGVSATEPWVVIECYNRCSHYDTAIEVYQCEDECGRLEAFTSLASPDVKACTWKLVTAYNWQCVPNDSTELYGGWGRPTVPPPGGIGTQPQPFQPAPGWGGLNACQQSCAQTFGASFEMRQACNARCGAEETELHPDAKACTWKQMSPTNWQCVPNDSTELAKKDCEASCKKFCKDDAKCFKGCMKKCQKTFEEEETELKEASDMWKKIGALTPCQQKCAKKCGSDKKCYMACVKKICKAAEEETELKEAKEMWEKVGKLTPCQQKCAKVCGSDKKCYMACTKKCKAAEEETELKAKEMWEKIGKLTPCQQKCAKVCGSDKKCYMACTKKCKAAEEETSFMPTICKTKCGSSWSALPCRTACNTRITACIASCLGKVTCTAKCGTVWVEEEEMENLQLLI